MPLDGVDLTPENKILTRSEVSQQQYEITIFSIIIIYQRHCLYNDVCML